MICCARLESRLKAGMGAIIDLYFTVLVAKLHMLIALLLPLLQIHKHPTLISCMLGQLDPLRSAPDTLGCRLCGPCEARRGSGSG